MCTRYMYTYIFQLSKICQLFIDYCFYTYVYLYIHHYSCIKISVFNHNIMLFLILIITCYMQEGYTPLLLACLNSLSNVAQLLIDKGASMDVTDKVSYL